PRPRSPLPRLRGGSPSSPASGGKSARALLVDVGPMKKARLVPDPWSTLRALTSARIGLARSGASLATAPLLALRLAEPRARDGVKERLDAARLADDLAALGGPVLTVASAAADRQSYLMRPDLGRRLAPGADAVLVPHAGTYDVAFVVADGLSARAVQTHA